MEKSLFVLLILRNWILTSSLNLIINNSSTSTTNITACDSYDWNGTTYTTSGTYNHLVQNSQPTNIARGFQTNLEVNSQKISAQSVLNVNSTIGW